MYDSKRSREYCEELGMTFSEADFDQFCSAASQHNLTQDQVDFAMCQHAWRIKCLFNPKSYSYINRIKLAIHFLNPFSKGI